MPLETGKSREAFEHNVKEEISAGKPQSQAVAIAYSKQRGDSWKEDEDSVDGAEEQQEIRRRRMDKLAKADAAISEMNKNADWLGQRMDAMASRSDAADYAVAKATRDAMQAEVDRTTAELKRIAPDNVKSAMGLTPDSIRATPEWKAAKINFDRAFQNLRNFNGTFVNQFKKEIRAERRF